MPNDSEKKDPTVIQQTGWLRGKHGYPLKEEFGFDVNPDRLELPSKEEINRLLAEERKRRLRLNALPAHLEPPEVLARMAEEQNLEQTLKEWAKLHVTNRALSMKQGIDVMITPASQALLKAAKILVESTH